MRGLAASLLAFGLVVTPVMARTSGPGDNDKDTAKTAGTDKADKTGDTKPTSATSTTTSTTATPATPGTTAVESELQQVRELLAAQAREIQMQNDLMKAQQQKMEMMEEELKAASTPVDTSSAVAPPSRAFGNGIVGTADGEVEDRSAAFAAERVATRHVRRPLGSPFVPTHVYSLAWCCTDFGSASPRADRVGLAVTGVV